MIIARKRSLNVQITAVTLVLALGAVGALASYAFWAMQRVDALAHERETILVQRSIQDVWDQTARDQHSITQWDDAVLQLERPVLDMAWLDENLGTWMYDFFGYDALVVLDAQDEPLLVSMDGALVPPSRLGAEAAMLRAMSALLREKIAQTDPEEVADLILQDYATVWGRVSLVSIAPIVPGTDAIERDPATAPLHIVVRHLDSGLLPKMGERQLIKELAFADRAPEGHDHEFMPLHDSNGRRIGYASWHRDQPGRQLLHDALPGLFAGGAAALVLVMFLHLRLRREVAERQASETQAQHLAFHDTLTGLPNRALFDDRLEKALAAVRRGQGDVALHYIDLDGFKNVNDTLGHPAGDDLIQQVAGRLSNAIREADTVARLGGDEFAVIQAEAQGAEGAEQLAARILEAMRRPFDLMGDTTDVSASIGVALAPVDAITRLELSRRADIALYEAKSGGKNKACFFARDLEATILRKRALEQDLRQALKTGDGLHLVYQPLFAVDGVTVLGAEALVRWRHPRLGELAPSVFVPVAEERFLIQPLGEWILRRACEDAVALDLPWISVNVSPHQLREPGFVGCVTRILRETTLPPQRLQLEITESCLIEPVELVAAALKQLRKAGVVIALDDFGTGFSSLHYLRDFRVDKIKIDRSFVQGATGREASGSIIRSMVDLGRSLGMTITAEGVETEEQWRALVGYGCHELQGYQFARPLTVESFRSVLFTTRLGTGGS